MVRLVSALVLPAPSQRAAVQQWLPARTREPVRDARTAEGIVTDDRDYWFYEVTPDPADAYAKDVAEHAARRRESPERRCYLSPTTRGKVAAVRSRSYVVKARDDTRRAWGR